MKDAPVDVASHSDYNEMMFHYECTNIIFICENHGFNPTIIEMMSMEWCGPFNLTINICVYIMAASSEVLNVLNFKSQTHVKNKIYRIFFRTTIKYHNLLKHLNHGE